MRGRSGEEKLLKNAKDECASEALEIATYEALQRVAEAVGDEETAELARRIRDDEERMLARLRQEIPKLAAAVVGAEVEGRPTYRIDRTGSADATRRAVRTTRRAGRRTAGAAARRVAEAGQETAGTAGAAGREAASVADAAAARVEESGEKTARTTRPARRRSQTESRSHGTRDGKANGRSSKSRTTPTTVEEAAERQLDDKG
jgi:hypothetical protein